MQINPLYHRTVDNPAEGVKFDADEAGQVEACTYALLGLDFAELDTVRSALGHYAIRLEELATWTEGGNEDVRAAEHARALVLFTAVRRAQTAQTTERFGPQS